MTQARVVLYYSTRHWKCYSMLVGSSEEVNARSSHQPPLLWVELQLQYAMWLCYTADFAFVPCPVH